MPKARVCVRSCGTVCVSSKALRRHVHKKHGPLPDVCMLCKEPFLLPKSLEQHMGNFDHSKDRSSMKPKRRRRPKADTNILQSNISNSQVGV